MKKLLMTTAAAAFAFAAMPAMAQEEGDPADVPEVEDIDDVEAGGKPSEPTAGGNGATVLREEADILEQARDPETGELLYEQNDDGTQGPAIMEVVGTARTQTVTTPSGNINTLTKTTDLDGNTTTTVEHYRPTREERVSLMEKPAKPERPTRPEKPEKPGKPESPGRP